MMDLGPGLRLIEARRTTATKFVQHDAVANLDVLTAALGLTAAGRSTLYRYAIDDSRDHALILAIDPIERDRLAIETAACALSARVSTTVPQLTQQLFDDAEADLDVMTLIALGTGLAVVTDPYRHTAKIQFSNTGHINRRLSYHMRIGDGVDWATGETGSRVPGGIIDGLFLQYAVPETIATAMKGRHLRDLVRHPLLDRLDARIADVRRLLDVFTTVDLDPSDTAPVPGESA